MSNAINKRLTRKEEKALRGAAKLFKQQMIADFNQDIFKILNKEMRITQAELAAIFSVSYDTILSWCGKRRKVCKERNIILANQIYDSYRDFLYQEQKKSNFASLADYIRVQGLYTPSPTKIEKSGEYKIIGSESINGKYKIETSTLKISFAKRSNNITINMKYPKPARIRGVPVEIRRGAVSFTYYHLKPSRTTNFIGGCFYFKRLFGNLVLLFEDSDVIRYHLSE